MKITVAIDSFKGSLTTFQAGEAARVGIKKVFPEAEVKICPLADGGEGTVSAIVSATGGEMRKISVTGPLGTPVMAEYGIIRETNTAVIEMSSAAGITLVAPELRDPRKTTTYGVGEMIADAINKGCREFIVGIGGSATNDGGIGMLSALGFGFYDENGAPVSIYGEGLSSIRRIDVSGAMPALRECRFHVACDVKNPLCGPMGCSAVYGPQKGATPEIVETMDGWLADYAQLTKEVLPHVDRNFPGSGAAGGLGFAFMSYLGGTLESGIELVMDAIGLEEYVKASDIVITGEGRLDGQSAMGKAPVGVARMAKKYGKPVVAFAGCVTEDAVAVNSDGIDAFFPVLRAPVSLEVAMDTKIAAKNLTATAEQAMRLARAFMK
ncbi:MAG: glycerate kinase [Ruminococcaceae bacterium]|nr:glycerate kinase [Oscillospiraceae bacterium]